MDPADAAASAARRPRARSAAPVNPVAAWAAPAAARSAARATVIEATQEGMAAAEVLLEPHFGAMSCLFTDLSDEQRAQLSEIMATLRVGMKARAQH